MDTNYEYVQAKAKLNNKFTHITHGNIEIDSYKIAQFNTGNGGWYNTETLLRNKIDKLNPDIISVSELSMNFEDNSFLVVFLDTIMTYS